MVLKWFAVCVALADSSAENYTPKIVEDTIFESLTDETIGAVSARVTHTFYVECPDPDAGENAPPEGWDAALDAWQDQCEKAISPWIPEVK